MSGPSQPLCGSAPGFRVHGRGADCRWAPDEPPGRRVVGPGRRKGCAGLCTAPMDEPLKRLPDWSEGIGTTPCPSRSWRVSRRSTDRHKAPELPGTGRLRTGLAFSSFAPAVDLQVDPPADPGSPNPATPRWCRQLLKDQPRIVADVLVQVAPLAFPPLLGSLAVRADCEQMDSYARPLRAAVLHCEAAEFQGLTGPQDRAP